MTFACFSGWCSLTSFTVHSFICFYRHMVKILWDVKTLGSYIFETILSNCCEIYRGYVMSGRELKYEFSSKSKTWQRMLLFWLINGTVMFYGLVGPPYNWNF